MATGLTRNPDLGHGDEVLKLNRIMIEVSTMCYQRPVSTSVECDKFAGIRTAEYHIQRIAANFNFNF